MIKIDTSNDSTCKAIITWCKENGHAYFFDTDKTRASCTYPFLIDAPKEREEEIEKLTK